jgi:hypothetical protein
VGGRDGGKQGRKGIMGNDVQQVDETNRDPLLRAHSFPRRSMRSHVYMGQLQISSLTPAGPVPPIPATTTSSTSILPARLLSPRNLQRQSYNRDNDALEQRGDITGPHPAACLARQTCSRREVAARGGGVAHHPYLREFWEGKGRPAPLDHSLLPPLRRALRLPSESARASLNPPFLHPPTFSPVQLGQWSHNADQGK